jgi:hypothetical protein
VNQSLVAGIPTTQPGLFTGRVTDSTGTPLGGLTVLEFATDPMFHDEIPIDGTTTADDGSFALDPQNTTTPFDVCAFYIPQFFGFGRADPSQAVCDESVTAPANLYFAVPFIQY